MGLLNSTAQQYYEENDFGNYQFTSLNDIINQFMMIYVGEDKIIPKAKRLDVAFHAQRALAELSFDTLKSCKAQEITVPASLQMILPQDYVNYTKVSRVDAAGIKHVLYPASKTSNPQSPQVDASGDFLFAENKLIDSGNLIINGNFHGGNASWNLNQNGFDLTQQAITVLSGTAFQPFTDQVGWFWDNNHIIGYNLPTNYAVRQEGVPIYSGEEYKITYTISGYSSGAYNFVIVNEDGHFSETTARSANGTYEETITSDLSNITTLYPAQSVYFQNTSNNDGNATIDNVSIVRVGNEETSNTWSSYKSATPSENNNENYEDDNYWPMDGSRFGIDPQHAQVNGSFYIDCVSGKIHFSSNVSGQTVILDYISDSLGTDGEMQVHKFAEEAMYKWISHAIMAGRANIPEYQVNRFKKERFAAIRTAKLRLSNLKLEELTQILRGKSKQIKH